MATYVKIYYLFEEDQSKSASLLAQVGTIQAVAGIALVLVAGMLISRFGAARLMRLFLFVTAVSFAIKFWTYTPANPWLQRMAPLPVPLFIRVPLRCSVTTSYAP